MAVVSFAGRPVPLLHSVLPGKPRDLLTMSAAEPLMDRAIRKARAELGDFLELAKSPDKARDPAVRVYLLERNEVEYVWVSQFRETESGHFAGVVEGDIVMKSRFKPGDPFTFVKGDIGDWVYTDKQGRIHGSYTECALLTLAPAAAADPIRRRHETNCVF